MKPTVPYLEAKFDEFNALIFDGSLPKVPVTVGNATSYIGLCSFKTHRRLFRQPEYYGFRLRFSSFYDLPEAEVEDTLIHEMIHYYIRLCGIRDTSAHGRVFRSMMADINTRFGRHILISFRPTPDQRAAALAARAERAAALAARAERAAALAARAARASRRRH